MLTPLTKRFFRAPWARLALACLCTLWLLALSPAPAQASSGSGHGGGGSGGSGDDDGGGPGPDDDGGGNGGSGSDSDDGGHDSDDSGSNSGSDDSDSDSNSGSSEDSGSNSGSSGGDDHSGSNSGSGSHSGSNSESNSGHGSSHSGESSANAGSGSSGHGGEIRLDRDDNGERIVEGEVVMVSSLASTPSRVTAAGLKVIESFQLASVGLRMVRVAVPQGVSAEQVMTKLRRIDGKALVTVNHVYSPAAGAPVQPLETTAPSSSSPMHGSIGLVDANVDARHPMLRGVTVTARNFGAASPSPELHGTAVASRIAASAPGANIMVANVFAKMPDGQEIASADAIARGLDWLAQKNVPVVNLSLTGPQNPILQAISAKLIARGHILVAAVGNEGPQAPPQYPAAYAGVVGVTAVDANDKVYRYANQGDYVHFAAPGVDAVVATPTGATEIASGTSYASPIVAVALARKLDRPDPAKAKAALADLEQHALDLGAPGRDPIYGYGLVRPLY